MSRLAPELERLYGLGAPDSSTPAAGDLLPGERRDIRVVVLEVVLPAGWQALSAVWKGVQSDLDLPAPAIAVSGAEGLQLWFSFASPVSPEAGARFLQSLGERYLPDTAPANVRAFAEAARRPAPPFREVGPQRWSAFVTSDLASVFADTPWLDIPPTDEGQATILRALEPVRAVAFRAALDTLGVTEDRMPHEPVARAAPAAAPTHGQPSTDPARFLTSVMNDETAPLALRIEAARVLLVHAERRGIGPGPT